MKFLRVPFVLICVVALVAGCANYEPQSSGPESPVVKTESEASNGQRTEKTAPAESESEAKASSAEESKSPWGETEETSQSTKELADQAEGIEQVEAESRGNNVILTLREKVLFSTRSAQIKSTARPVLDEVAKLLLDYPERMVMVSGHTDTQPTKTEQFPSNWDLSAKRAVNVVKYISYLPELDESRLIAAGFGEHHPVASNDTPEHRRLNRRVEIMLLPPGLPQQQIGLPE